MTSQLCYFPEMTQPSDAKSTVLPLKRKAKKEETVIRYFPELEDAEAQARTSAGRMTAAKLTPRIHEALNSDESYIAAIAQIGTGKIDAKKQAELLRNVVAATVRATITEVQTAPEKFQLDYPKSPWLPGYLKQLTAPLLEKTPDPEVASFEKDRLIKFQKIGQLLKRTREKRGLSHNQLNHLTHILTSHIVAIEAGDFKSLPEPLYVKGFIHRLGDALGLNGKAIAATFPMPKPPESRYKTAKKAQDTWTTEAGRYMGYTALMMGAVSGLSWSLQQAQKSVQPAPQPVTPPSNNQAADEVAPQIVQTDAKISPPEMMRMP
ncbi:hypothetical protein Lepto7376_2765 [[Leptolyngbya] sp. PCC 7376]|uniref:helix-turn-helix domain-containing protein n=1 Tax=[Leptolyngbya] sp. PCC 7376 TaxID=111781 RepID=UPI00029EED5A|nr:helix-turn-helix domain-containing protein [[Leptolyngbya] sp. PCC 7376]AFY39025.1 hypothetical protein Lepto7376_2765 [[Leptolyngbya] sp. PCC 7376]